jgi:hypothetical protein
MLAPAAKPRARAIAIVETVDFIANFSVLKPFITETREIGSTSTCMVIQGAKDV